MQRELGDKLGPRLSRLIVPHTIAVRTALAPIEATITAAATQQVIDRAGREVADLYRPLYRAILAESETMHPGVRELIERSISGTHQWEAIGGQLALGGITGGLSTILTNELAPAVQQIVSKNPNIHVDQTAAAAAAAAGVDTYADAQALAAEAGFNADNFALLYGLAQQPPPAAVVYQLLNRSLMDEPTADYWLHRNALPPALIPAIRALAVQVLSPADAALAVLRGILPLEDGYAVAKANGVTRADFDVLIGNTGEPLALEEMLLLYRWQKMDKATLEKGIKQSRVRDEWIPYAEMLGIVPPSGAEVIDAVIRGQISDSDARDRWHVAGGDPTWYETAKTSAANPPSPVQLAQMAHRGIIAWTGTGPDAVTFQQGIYEGDTKDKWEPYLRENAVYYPPPREIATLVKEGGLSRDAAMKLWAEAGMTTELANMYWQAAHYTKTSAVHELAQAEIVKLYTDKTISRAEALKMLESVNWPAEDAEYLLDIADFKAAAAAVTSAIAKIRALFIAYKIDATTAKAAMASLKVPDSQATQQLSVWTLERAANVKTLTAAEITDAWYYKLLSPGEAQKMLENFGYTAYDAWLLLNIKNKGPIQNFPPPA